MIHLIISPACGQLTDNTPRVLNLTHKLHMLVLTIW